MGAGDLTLLDALRDLAVDTDSDVRLIVASIAEIERLREALGFIHRSAHDGTLNLIQIARAALLLLFATVACAPIAATVTPVHPFGPGRHTVSTTTTVSPDHARSVAIATAADFCDERGERSLPSEVSLLTTWPLAYSVTVVFTCFDPEPMVGYEWGM